MNTTYQLLKDTIFISPDGYNNNKTIKTEHITTVLLSDNEYRFWNIYLQIYNKIIENNENSIKAPDFTIEQYRFIKSMKSDNANANNLDQLFNIDNIDVHFIISNNFNLKAINENDKFNYINLELLDKDTTDHRLKNSYFQHLKNIDELFKSINPDIMFVYLPYFVNSFDLQGFNFYMFNINIKDIIKSCTSYEQCISSIEKLAISYYKKLANYITQTYDLTKINIDECSLISFLRKDNLESDLEQINLRKVINWNPLKLESVKRKESDL